MITIETAQRTAITFKDLGVGAQAAAVGFASLHGAMERWKLENSKEMRKARHYRNYSKRLRIRNKYRKKVSAFNAWVMRG